MVWDEIVIRECDEQHGIGGIKVVDKESGVEIVSFREKQEIVIDLSAEETLELYLALRRILRGWL